MTTIPASLKARLQAMTVQMQQLSQMAQEAQSGIAAKKIDAESRQ